MKPIQVNLIPATELNTTLHNRYRKGILYLKKDFNIESWNPINIQIRDALEDTLEVN